VQLLSAYKLTVNLSNKHEISSPLSTLCLSNKLQYVYDIVNLLQALQPYNSKFMGMNDQNL